jgi:hypothetical protein
VQILVFPFRDLNAVTVYPDINWNPIKEFDPVTQTVNLHLYAESEDFMEANTSADHVTAAFSDLTRMFPGLDVAFAVPSTGIVPIDPYTGIPGVTPEDEMSLRELKWLNALPRGTEPANCVGLGDDNPPG